MSNFNYKRHGYVLWVNYKVKEVDIKADAFKLS